MTALFAILGSVLAMAVAVLLIIFLIVPIFKGLAYVIGYTFGGIGWFIVHIFQFVAGMITDTLRIVGALVTSLFFIPFILGTVVIGRWSASAHYGRALQEEIGTVGKCFYRVCIGHIAQLLMLGGLTEGIEQRLPAAMAHAPGSDRPSKRSGSFDGFTIVGSLKGGGSGGKLYVAEPDERKRLAFARMAGEDIDQVVIKSFSLHEGSSLPQIIRESRALEAAKKLGLVLEHELTDERFYYVMPYVPGDSLTAVSQRLHSQGDAEGLSTRDMRFGVGLIADLLITLDVYHRGGLWHKDVKPDNIIVHEGHAHLVDLGLVTPLRSAMTLTTHGTEYFRDPEMVRMALRGAKVHEVNGVKFDIYGTGAVLYSLLENSFPAHGGLSQLRKRCPEALRWVIRRSMAEMSQRYVSAGQMLTDVRAVIDADDPFAVKPKDLPSMADGAAPVVLEEPELHGELPVFATPSDQVTPPVGAGAAAQGPPAAPAQPVQGPAQHAGGVRRRPRISMTDFWTGKYRVDGEGVAARAGSPAPHPAPVRPQVVPVGMRKSAAEQRKHAQQRVHDMQNRVQSRMRGHGKKGRYSSSPNMGVGVALLFLLGVGVLAALVFPIVAGFQGMGQASAISSTAVLGEGEFDVVFDKTDGNTRALRIHTAVNDEVTVTRVATVESSPRILVLPADGMVSGLDRLSRVFQRLERDGFVVLGPSADGETLTIIAEAIKEIGPGAHPGDIEASNRLRAWIGTGRAHLDGVLLVGTGEEAGQLGLITAEGVPVRQIIDSMSTAYDADGSAMAVNEHVEPSHGDGASQVSNTVSY